MERRARVPDGAVGRGDERPPHRGVADAREMHRDILFATAPQRDLAVEQRVEGHSTCHMLVSEAEDRACDAVRTDDAPIVVQRNEQRGRTVVARNGGDDPGAMKGVAEEPFFDLPGVDELKLSTAL